MALVQADHGLHTGNVVLGRRIGHSRMRSLVIPRKGALQSRQFGRGLICDAGHHRGDRLGKAEAGGGGVGVAGGHEQCTEVGIAEAECAKAVTVVGDPFGRVGGAIYNDFLGDNKNLCGGGEAFGIEAFRRTKLDQVQRR